MPEETRQLLVFGEKTFKITVPANAKITFGPFAPPTRADMDYRSSSRAVGTLRIYDKSKERIIACFTPVSGFRDLALEYAEQVAVEEGASIWKSDQDGYTREDKVTRAKKWVGEIEQGDGDF
jgi:hypothetical protein